MLSPLVVFNFPVAGSRPPWIPEFLCPLPFIEVAFRLCHLAYVNGTRLIPIINVVFHVSAAS